MFSKSDHGIFRISRARPKTVLGRDFRIKSLSAAIIINGRLWVWEALPTFLFPNRNGMRWPPPMGICSTYKRERGVPKFHTLQTKQEPVCCLSRGDHPARPTQPPTHHIPAWCKILSKKTAKIINSKVWKQERIVALWMSKKSQNYIFPCVIGESFHCIPEGTITSLFLLFQTNLPRRNIRIKTFHFLLLLRSERISHVFHPLPRMVSPLEKGIYLDIPHFPTKNKRKRKLRQKNDSKSRDSRFPLCIPSAESWFPPRQWIRRRKLFFSFRLRMWELIGRESRERRRRRGLINNWRR